MENFLLKYITSKLSKILSLVFGIALLVILFALVDNFIGKFFVSNHRLIFYIFIIVFWILFWFWYRFRLPRNIKGKIGLIICVYAETEVEEKRLKNDFIAQLEKNLIAEQLHGLINVIVVKNHIAKKIKNAEYIKKINRKIKGHFYLFGTVKRRQDGQNSYFLNLDGAVFHAPLDLKTDNALLRDFLAVLPKQVSFYETFEFRGFQFSSQIVYLAVKYITGIAAYLSGDPSMALRLHKDLQSEFRKLAQTLPPNLEMINKRIPLFISDENLALARFYYMKSDIPNINKYLNEALKNNPNSYGAWALKAIKDFEIDNNPQEALKSMRVARKHSPGSIHEWRYSKAFLEFWLEKYKAALYECDRIAKSSYENEKLTIDDVESFNLKLLASNHFKPQLYFWLGFINYKKKKNLPEALKYFEGFKDHITQDMVLLKERANMYLGEIKQELEIK